MYREVYRIGICFQPFFEVNLWTKKRLKKHENYDNNLQKVYDFPVVDIRKWL